MNLATKKLKDLIPAGYNPRKDLQPGDPSYESLKKSIKRWGLVEPIVWNKRGGKGKGVVVGGHQRLKVLLAEGAEETEVVVVDLPEGEEKALNLALNKIQGAWDYPKLMLILDEMMIAPPEGFDLEATGFSLGDIAEIEARTKRGTAQEDDFNAEEEALKIKKAETKLGDLWQLGEHRLLCGDATVAENINTLMRGGKASCYITDPPYGVNLNEKNAMLGALGRGKDWGDLDNDVDLKALPGFLKSLFEASAQGLQEKAAWYIWHGGVTVEAFLTALCPLGFLLHDIIIWNKPRLIIGRKDYKWKHEPCLYGWIKGYRPPFYGPKNENTVWDIEYDSGNAQSGNEHPTQKPVELYARAMRNSSKKGEAILDSCAGSGTAIIAAEQLGRRAYLMEIDPVYCDVIVKRWEKFTGKEARLTNRPRGG